MGPITPNSAYFPTGLGIGLTERDGVTVVSTSPPRAQAVSTAGDDIAQYAKRPIETPKGKRKPVPDIEVAQAADSDEDDLNAMMGRAHVGVAHAS